MSDETSQESGFPNVYSRRKLPLMKRGKPEKMLSAGELKKRVYEGTKVEDLEEDVPIVLEQDNAAPDVVMDDPRMNSMDSYTLSPVIYPFIYDGLSQDFESDIESAILSNCASGSEPWKVLSSIDKSIKSSILEFTEVPPENSSKSRSIGRRIAVLFCAMESF